MAYQALFYHHLKGVYDTSMCIVNNKERIRNSFSMNPSSFIFFFIRSKWENILLLSLWGERNLCLSAGKN